MKIQIALHKKLLILTLIALWLTGCSDILRNCLPVSLAKDLQSNTIQLLWQRKLNDVIEARTILAKDLDGKLTPILLLNDSKNWRVALVQLKQFSSTPVYLTWIDDEIQKKSALGLPYTTIHTIGYLSPELYLGKSMFTIDFTFQSKENKNDIGNEFFYCVSAFQKGVIWFPTTNFDFEDYRYLLEITVDTKESMATNTARTTGSVYYEWKQRFEPTINIVDRPVKLSQLNWIYLNNATECIKIE